MYRQEDFDRYTGLKDKIRSTVASKFDISAPLHLTKPTFFSYISDKEAVTEHDEYWHNHIDKVCTAECTANIVHHLSSTRCWLVVYTCSTHHCRLPVLYHNALLVLMAVGHIW